jgi:hypothetical protein
VETHLQQQVDLKAMREKISTRRSSESREKWLLFSILLLFLEPRDAIAGQSADRDEGETRRAVPPSVNLVANF